MKLYQLSSLLLMGVAVAAPPPFVLQGSADLNLPANEAELSHLTHLSTDDFLHVEQAKAKAEQVMHSLVDRLEKVAIQYEQDVEQLLQAEQEGAASPTDAAARFPHPGPPPVLNFSDYTILEILNASLHHHPKEGADAESLPKWKLPWPKPPHHGEHEHDPKYLPLHRLGWLVNQSVEAQKALGKDGITLLAPDDFALRPPPHHQKKHSAPPKSSRRSEQDQDEPTSAELEHFEAQRQEEQEHQPIPHPFHLIAKSGKKCKKMMQKLESAGEEEDRKKLWAKIIAHVLAYHTLPEIRTERSLVDSSTVATTHDTERIKVEPTFHPFPHPHPSLKFNGYSHKKGPTIIAKNGIIHLVGAPLLPPLTPLNQLFLFPEVFSTLTSGLQKVDLASKLLPEVEGDDEMATEFSALETESMMQSVIEELMKEYKDVGLFTVFAPGNWAFNKLGPKILAFLHSPFSLSRHALKYVLAYHIVPDLEFFTDFVRNDTKEVRPSDAFIVKEEVDVEVPVEWIVDGKGEGAFPPPPPPHGDHPPPPPHGDHPPPPPHFKANLTHYRLPTLLSTSGENANATLRVVVIAHRPWGHGPVKRDIVVLPHAMPPPHHDEENKFGGERRGPPPPRPVKVFKTDLPARHGAIQWVESLLRPPFPHHNDDDDLKASNSGHKKHGNKRMRKALAELFA
ncbi:hypothetical protein BCR35DRAFT_298138 [Leucosporidium creatinivorum]|uniref:FAS1 domain-containing protein n=1 Tax=Leucosporidium creatinivorum TaxID=106004 RepID=A0A1Y2G7X6_9BASI|nr:hypothetical protein BCR35DRAFT_298138 [Leucosporidium creatinivorum]